jgi:5-(carboxyamino)imidazole ribonucleotide mutase
MAQPLVGILMGSDSDWDVMQHAARRLQDFQVEYEARVVSAHRTPDLLYRYAEDAAGRGAASLPGRAEQPISPE